MVFGISASHFCVFFYIISLINGFNYKDDIYEKYEVISSNLLHSDSVDTNSFKKIRSRRDINESVPPPQPTLSDPSLNKKLTKVLLTSTEGGPPQRTNSRQLDSTFSTPVSPLVNLTQSTSIPLLGFNGTGQRKEVQITPKPTIVSDPINPTATIVNTNTLSGKSNTDKPLTTLEVDDPINIDNVDKYDKDTNTTLLQNNLTKFDEDYHIYYNSTMSIDKAALDGYWKNFTNFNISNLLSKSYRRAMTVQLSFDFPFYGHPIRNVTVATGGFLYTGEYVHSWLAATQYIAPLMANFDTTATNDSFVKFRDNGTSFTVLWENVTLQDRENVGTFTFGVTLHKNGDILFTYFSVPINIDKIQDDKHPVKVGLSDAYIMDKTIFFARRKTIYEYHRVNFGNGDIQNGTMIYLMAQPTCLSSSDCQSCLSDFTALRCVWCPNLNRCSTGMDRKRQDWLAKGCDRNQIMDKMICPALGERGNNAAFSSSESTQTDTVEIPHHESWNIDVAGNPSGTKLIQNGAIDNTLASRQNISDHEEENKSGDGLGMVVGVLFPIGLISIICMWVIYAYRNPHTKSGQFLIQYRPSQWSWRRGEARYTAATIHM